MEKQDFTLMVPEDGTTVGSPVYKKEFYFCLLIRFDILKNARDFTREEYTFIYHYFMTIKTHRT